MSTSDFECIVYDAASLLPASWQALAASGPVRTFNPALLRDGAGWMLAYRVVLPDGLRRIAIARLGPDLRVVERSPLPFSDRVKFPAAAPYPTVARQWLADPRLYRWEDRLFIYWNSGWHEPQNHQFLQELDPFTLDPIGAPREMVLRAARRPLEKNWTLFAETSGELCAVYSVTPHRVLRFSLAGEGDIVFDEITNHGWTQSEYPASHGGLRGGAPPVWHAGCYWSICHSVQDGAEGYCYAPGVYCFSGGPGFLPVAEPIAPLDLARALRTTRAHPRLNPAVDQVIYPCGAALEGTRWLISHGINDEKCAISLVPHAAVQASVRLRT